MSEVIDQKVNSYGHGIISQNCFAKEYSGSEFVVKLVFTGTFVQVHSIRDDDVLFYIVRDDMQVEMNQMVCKKTDIINVPENLWGPLFTVRKVARLSLVKDSEIAESIGNISVGDTVRVLGPDNSEICIANVTFRNSIGKLGVGIYFGLQVLASKENLQTIIEKVSLLGPGTKGFPRGCDIVVTVDKIRPDNCSFSKEQFVRNYDKEFQKHFSFKSLPSGENFESGSFKSIIPYSTKEKHSTCCKKDHRESDFDSEINMNRSCLKKRFNSDSPLNVGDEVIYLEGVAPEKGVIRWMGLIENSPKVGVEFENPISSGRGLVDGLGELFRAKHQHAMVVPPMALVKLSDYQMNSSKNTTYLRKKNNINNNINSKNNINNNNNNINNNNSNNNNNNNLKIYSNTSSNVNNNEDYCRANEFCCETKQNAEEIYIKSKRPSYQCLSHVEKQFDSPDCSLEGQKNDIPDRKNSFIVAPKSEGVFEGEEKNISKSFDFNRPNERKSLSYKKHYASVDNSLMQKDSNSFPEAQNGKNFLCWNLSSHDVSSFEGAIPEKIRHNYGCADSNLQKCSDEEDDDLASLKSVNAHSRNVYEKILEASLFSKISNRSTGTDGEVLYDVPPGKIRRYFSYDKSSIHIEDSHKQDFYMGRRHTLAPSVSKHEFSDFWNTAKDKWDSQYSEQSSSDENLDNCCESSNPSRSMGFVPEDLGKGSVVELTFKGEPHYGVIRWIGTIPSEKDGPHRLIAGVEMEEEYPGFTDGTFNNKRYFQCNARKALFIPLSKCRKDSRFSEEFQKQNLTTKINYGQIDCPIVEGTIPPINRKGDIESICGKNRGIQGHHNSCYLDATLFSMFAFTSVFDSLLYRPPTKSDIPQYSEVQRVLREEIVNPLRKNLYVRADRVMKLRTLLEKLSSVSGLTSEEKDPEEFLNSLLAQILKAEPFLKLSSGQEAFHYQLFVEKDERLVIPSVQQLFEQSFVTSDIKLKQVPSCLIIQMPRFGKSFKMYSRILPPQLLDITDIIENSPRQCTVCGKLAEYECKDCFGQQQGIGNVLESISFCKTCLDTAHNHHWRSRHNARALTVPVEFYELQEHCIIPRLYMELFAVVCIETSHYVAFVKCGSGSDAPWCFFDSMADRKGEQNGYNIPEMVPCPDLPYWLSEDGAKMLNEMRDERQLPEHAKRLFSDAYMCMYQSPDLMMYR